MGTVVTPRRPHVALLAFPFGTHAAPLFALAQAIASAVPSAALSFISSARSNAALRHAAEMHAGLRLYDVPDGSPPGVPPLPPPEEVRRFIELTPANFLGALAAAEADVGSPVSCFVSDAFLWFVAELAAEACAPWVPFFTGGAVSLSAHLYTDLIREKFGCPCGNEDENLRIPGFSSLQVQDLPDGIISGNLQSSFACLLHRMALELPRADALVLNTFQGLTPEVESDFIAKFKQLLPLGPLHLLAPSPAIQDEQGCLLWLDRHDPGTVVYISFGSLMSLPPAELRELALGLEASGVPFLWSLKESQMVHLPQGFLGRGGLVVSWAPQVRVLSHAALGAFMTHCGWNSVMESIVGGVPMICRPFLGDQMLNSRMVSHVWKIGVRLEGDTVTKDSVSYALNTIMKTQEGKDMKGRVGKLKLQAMKAVSPKGSSVESFKAFVKIATRS